MHTMIFMEKFVFLRRGTSEAGHVAARLRPCNPSRARRYDRPPTCTAAPRRTGRQFRFSENAGRSLAAADAHRDHSVLRIAALHFAQDRCGQFAPVHPSG